MFLGERQFFPILLPQMGLASNEPFLFFSVDEVGRGCVAGPVVVCASLWLCSFSFPNEFSTKIFDQVPFFLPSIEDEIKDSKKLSHLKRERLSQKVLTVLKYEDIPCAPQCFPSSLSQLKPSIRKFFFRKEHLVSKESQWNIYCVDVCLGTASVREIDEINIWNAIQLAVNRALHHLVEKGRMQPFLTKNVLEKQSFFIMDGNKAIGLLPCFQAIPQVVLVDADNLLCSVGLSSILAKVWRDAEMEKQGLILPQYGFETHKGYGTKRHFQKIQEHGLSFFHRSSFLRNNNKIT